MGRGSLAIGFSVACVLVLPGLGRAYTFIDVVNSDGPYDQFTPPSINDSGDVAFRANLDGGGWAIVTGNGSGTSVVADTSGPYSVFLTEVAINDGGTVVFHADRDAGGGTGIYTGPDPATDAVAEEDATFLSVDLFSINTAGTIVFNARLTDGPRGIFIGTSPVVDNSGTFLYFDIPDINDAGTVAFRATLDSLDYGIYTNTSTVAEMSGPYAGFGNSSRSTRPEPSRSPRRSMGAGAACS
jgi:hypothetical protein